MRPALKLPEQHFHFSAVVCILMIHLQPASRSPTGRQLSLAFSRFICSVHRGPPPYHFHFSALSTVMSPVLGATDAYRTLQLGCPRGSCGRMHPYTVHLHSAAVLPEEVLWSNASAQFICTLQLCCPRRALCSCAAQRGSVVYLWSNASAEFICTMQPLRPSKEAQACRYGVHLHSAALLPERLGQG